MTNQVKIQYRLTEDGFLEISAYVGSRVFWAKGTTPIKSLDDELAALPAALQELAHWISDARKRRERIAE